MSNLVLLPAGAKYRQLANKPDILSLVRSALKICLGYFMPINASKIFLVVWYALHWPSKKHVNALWSRGACRGYRDRAVHFSGSQWAKASDRLIKTRFPLGGEGQNDLQRCSRTESAISKVAVVCTHVSWGSTHILTKQLLIDWLLAPG